MQKTSYGVTRYHSGVTYCISLSRHIILYHSGSESVVMIKDFVKVSNLRKVDSIFIL